MGGMAAVAFVPHRGRPDVAFLTKAAAARLEDLGHEVRVLEADALATGLEPWSVPVEALRAGLDLAVSVGGDGTMLRALDLANPAGAPVLGVHVGNLGYLTEVDPLDLDDALDRFLVGDYCVEERMTLQVSVGSPSGERLKMRSAVNEAVVQRASGSLVVHIEVRVDNVAFKTYVADGLIVATPTGSTAYNLSARGPIVEPDLEALLLTAVSPHELFDRTLVFGGSRELRLEVLESRPTELVVDGTHVARLQPRDVVVCRRGSRPARLVVFRPRDFLGVVKTKFGLGDR